MAGKTAVLALKIIGDATGAQKAAGQTKKEISGLEKAMDGMTGKAAGAGAAAGAALVMGLGDALEDSSLNNKLAAQLNLNPADQAAAGELAGSLYRDAYGESLAEVNDAIAAVGSSLTTMSANGGADVERLTKKALDLAAVFDVDVAESTAAAGAMMTSGLATDADQAMDTIVSAMQRVPAGVRDEILPSLTEYSKHYAQLGLDADTVAGIMVNASSQGAIGVDKMGDALKELTIRSTDMSPATQAAYDAMGLSMEDMTNRMLAGGDTANGAFAEIVHGLQQIPDAGQQAGAAVALFGTPLEDLGTDQIPAFLGQIDPMGDAFASVAGAADEMGTKINTGPAVALDEFKRNALGSFQDMAAQALPLLEPVLGFLQQFAPVLGPLALVIGVVTGAMLLLNLAMSLNPVGLIVIAVAALIGGLIAAYQNVGWFKDAVNTAGQIAVAVFSAVVTWVSNVVNWFVNVIGQSATFQAMIDLLGAYFSLLGTLAEAAWNLIVTGVTAAIDWVKSITTENQTFMDAMGTLGDIGKAAFKVIDDAIATTIGWVKDAVGWFQDLFGAKNDAAAADAGAGAGAGGRAATLNTGGRMLAEPMAMMTMARSTAVPAAEPAAAFSAYAAGPTSALAGSISRLGRTAPAAATTVNVKVEFTGVVTDKVGTAREIKKLLEDEALLIGGR